MKQLIYILALLIFISTYASAQKYPKLIRISKIVGDTIDMQEREKHNLFIDYSDTYKNAIFFENEDKSKMLVIYLQDGNKIEKKLTLSEYHNYKKRIKKAPIDYNNIDTTKFCVIKLIDESALSGKIIKISKENIEFKTKYMGEIIIPKKRIIEIIVLDTYGKQVNKYWQPNPHDSRLFYAPTARNIPKGEGYLQDIYLLLISANYGLTDYLSIGAGMSIVPIVGLDYQVYLFNTKFGYNVNDNLSIGGGFLYLNIPAFDEKVVEKEVTAFYMDTDSIFTTTYTDYEEIVSRQDAGILFGVATYGNRENNVTLGCGYAYYNDKFLKTPVIVLGGMLRSSRRTALVTENWFARIPNEYDEEEYGANLPESSSILLISYGIRFMGERMSIDFAFVQAIEDSSLDDLIFPGIPYLDFVIKF